MLAAQAAPDHVGVGEPAEVIGHEDELDAGALPGGDDLLRRSHAVVGEVGVAVDDAAEVDQPVGAGLGRRPLPLQRGQRRFGPRINVEAPPGKRRLGEQDNHKGTKNTKRHKGLLCDLGVVRGLAESPHGTFGTKAPTGNMAGYAAKRGAH